MKPINYIWKRLSRLSVGQKVMTVILVELASYSMITTIAISQIHAVGTEVRHMADLYLPLFSSTESIRQSIQEGRLNLKEIIFVGGRVVYDRDAEETYLRARSGYQDSNTAISEQIRWSENLIEVFLRNEAGDDPLFAKYSQPLIQQLSRIRQANRIQTNRVAKIFQHIEDGSFLMGMEMLDEVAASERTLTAELDQLVGMLQEVKRTSVEYATRVEDTASRYTMLASMVTVSLVIVVVFWVIRRNISRPLRMMTHVIGSFDATQQEVITPSERHLLSRHDELGEVSKTFSRLKQDLRARDRALQVAKNEADRANRAKSLFLASASHDLRQPMHAMQMYIAALRHKVGNKDALNIITDIEAVSVSTARLLNALLDISKLEAGAVKPQFENFAIQEVFRRVGRAYRPEAYRKNLQLRFVTTDAYVHSDPDLLERIVGNFVSNAIRYTDSGKVLVGCRRRGNRIAVEVWDTGCGIPADQQSAVFEDFYQLKNKERDRSKGLGLGLAIVRRLALCLDHEIERESVLGRGSRFAVLVQTGTQQLVEKTDPAHLSELYSDLTGARVLLIEDDFDVLNASTQLLHFWGCELKATSRFEDAMMQIENGFEPDVILADYRLPGKVNGIGAIMEIRAVLDRLVPAIVVTGEVEGLEMNSLSGQSINVLHKPLRPARLRSLLSKLLINKTRDDTRSEVA